MSEKRRDNKGRILQNSESQRPDGKYEFKYTDSSGRHSVYSWKLVATDKVPPGKRQCEALRDIEKHILRDIEDDIDTKRSQETTLNDCFDEYVSHKIIKPTTKSEYLYRYEKYIRHNIGFMKISNIERSDIKKLYSHLAINLKLTSGTIRGIHTMICPLFNMAVRDNIIRSNPTDGVLSELHIQHIAEKQKKRHSLTEQQQDRFIEFISQNSKYKNLKTIFTVMLGTGLRIGELCGLRWEDCDFENNIIKINHNLLYNARKNETCQRARISTPKTRAGVRDIPMFTEVKLALLKEYEYQKIHGFNTFCVDGYTGFVFGCTRDKILRGWYVNYWIKRIIKDANTQEMKNAKTEGRQPILLPHFSCHNLRHTFCTRMCENESNVKLIQEVMGHTDIRVTMDVYNETTREKKLESFARLDGAFKIS